MNVPIFQSTADDVRPGRWRAISLLAVSLAVHIWPAAARAQEPAAQAQPGQPVSARDQAQTFLENDEARKAVATLAEAARTNPADRVIGAMLYGAIRDHVWHLPQMLPVLLDGPVHVLEFSADGTLLASGAESGQVIVASTEPLDEDDAKGRRTELKEQSAILGLEFSPDGNRLAIASEKDGLKIWDVRTRAVAFEGPKPGSAVTAFASIPKRNLVAIGTETGAIQVLDVAAGKVLSQPSGAKAKIVDLAFSPDGTRLGAACGDQTALMWDAATGSAIGSPMPRTVAITSIDISVDGRYLLVAGANKEAALIDPDSGVDVMPVMKCGAGIKKARISTDGSRIATMLDDGGIRFWDALTGKELPFNVREDGHLTDMSWGPVGLRVVTGSEDNHASLWSMRDGTRWGEALPHEAPVLKVVYSQDGTLLATSCSDGKVRVWRMDGGKAMPTVRSHSVRARAAFYSLDGGHLVTTSEDHTALHWISGQVRPFGPPLKHKGKVLCGTFDKEATRILTCDDTGMVGVWKTDTGKADGVPYQLKGAVTWVDFHPDGARFVATSGPSAFIWSLTNRKNPVATIAHPGGAKSTLKCARFSPDGKWLATASTDGTARIWDAATYKPAAGPINRGFPVLCVRFSPDSSRLLVAGEDGQAVVYDTATWKPVGQPILLPGPVFSAAMTADNLFIVATSLLLNAVQFFEIETGRALGRGPAVPSQATCVDYHLPDKVVTVACDDGTIRSFGSAFVVEDVPAWACFFAERLAGFHKTGPETFERVDSHVGQLNNYLTGAAKAENADFARLARWKMTMGTGRTGFPRFVSTIAANIENRIEERSVDALYECYEAAPADSLVLAALSLYLGNRRQSEFLADFVVADKKASPLALAYAASTLINSGRSDEARTVIDKAIAAAPNDPKVLRREAKLNARLMDKRLAIEQFEKALKIEPDNFETHRAYAWMLYNVGEPEKAGAQFHLAQDLTGDLNSDIVAGLCLTAAAVRNNTDATRAYRQLVTIDPAWKEASYITSLTGWTERESRALEAIRGSLFPKRR